MKNTTEFIKKLGPWVILAPQAALPVLPLLAIGAAACAVSDICEKVQEKK